MSSALLCFMLLCCVELCSPSLERWERTTQHSLAALLWQKRVMVKNHDRHMQQRFGVLAAWGGVL